MVKVAAASLPPDRDTDMDGQLTNKLHDLNKTRALCSEIIESALLGVHRGLRSFLLLQDIFAPVFHRNGSRGWVPEHNIYRC